MKQNFIRTQDEHTANCLLKLGYHQIHKNDNFFVFINDQSLKFDNSINIKNLNFTNMLYV